MKTLIITVAGTATRFNRDTQEPTLKCLYNIGGVKNTLLYRILDKARDFDEYIIVGGYLYDRLTDFVETGLAEFKDKIKVVFNREFAGYGSAYSLILGIENSSPVSDEIVFVEGDLYYDAAGFEKVCKSRRNVFTVNHDLIMSRKSVVVYENAEHYLRYIYDTRHECLRIDEPFLAVYNSAQVWKFADVLRLRNVLDNLTSEQKRGTNLEIIQDYFGKLGAEEYEMVQFDLWFNCNTVEDYKNVFSIIAR